MEIINAMPKRVWQITADYASTNHLILDDRLTFRFMH